MKYHFEYHIPIELALAARKLSVLGIRLFVVGGFCRDIIQGKEPRDIDIVVEFSDSDEKLEKILSIFGELKDGQKGKNFGVYIWRPNGSDVWYEVVRTRREHSGGAYRDAEVDTINVLIMEDLLRRDITMNSIAYEITTGEIFAPDHAVTDAREFYVKENNEYFKRSIERPLRLARLVCKFEEAEASENIINMCRDMAYRCGWGISHDWAKMLDLDALPKDQIWAQWEKMCLEPYPGHFMHFLGWTNWLQFMPELNALLLIPQEPEYHPEGSVFIHTFHVANAAANIIRHEIEPSHVNWKNYATVLVTAAYCHDMGKTVATENKDGRIVSPGHDAAGVPIAERFLKSIGAPNHVIKQVLELVELHMFHVHMQQSNPEKAARWILSKLRYNHPDMLRWLIEADYSGRPPLPAGLPVDAKEIFDIAYKKYGNVFLQVVTGKFLLEHFPEYKGKDVGRIIDICIKAQVKGAVYDEDSAIKVIKGIRL